MRLALLTVVLLNSFFSTYPDKARFAMDFWKEHPACYDTLRLTMSEKEAVMALSVVSPEVSQFSQLEDLAQIKAMALVYIVHGQGDYSIGFFQMKPSFALRIEQRVAADNTLKRRHGRLPIQYSKAEDPEGRYQRHDRLERLRSLEWQVRYLAAFVDIVKQKTATMSFKSEEDRLRHWATLYNAGIDSSPNRIASCLSKKQFPRHGVKFNYAEVSLEFYQELQKNR